MDLFLTEADESPLCKNVIVKQRVCYLQYPLSKIRSVNVSQKVCMLFAVPLEQNQKCNL